MLQGTQLLAIDTGAAMGLLKRSLIGEELTQKEKQALQRTLTDLASVVPIGILMLLPVSISFAFVPSEHVTWGQTYKRRGCHPAPPQSSSEITPIQDGTALGNPPD